MSCDFAVWFPHRRLSDEQAGAVYAQLCEGNAAGVKAAPAVDAFHRELTAVHPETDPVWSVPFDRSPGHVILSCVLPKAEYVEGLVRELARKHGLAVYDPQSGTVTNPDAPKQPGAPGGSPMRFW